MFNPIILEETFGNILINPVLYNADMHTRLRYTRMHECAHFILHKSYYNRKNENLKNRVGNTPSYIACRGVELNKTKNITDEDWLEWQADYLAAALLMPKNVFLNYTHKIMTKNGISGKYISYPETFSLELSSEVQQFIKKDFFRGLPAETFARTPVQKRSNPINIFLCDIGKRSAFWKELTK